MAKQKTATTRHDVVLIRDSTDGQDEKPQRANVAHLLQQRSVHVPEQHWKLFVVSRSKVLSGREFDGVMAEVRDNRVGAIYVESQDRFGGKNSKELFTVLNTLQKHGTKLIDLTEDLDLTSDELIDEIRTFLASQKSQEELRSIGRRSIRSRVNSFKEHGNWCTGAAPFGYGKRLIKAVDGTVRWEWHPTKSGAVGDRYNVDGKGNLVMIDAGVKVPPRDRRSRGERPDRIYLIPHRDPEIVRTVQLMFELYAVQGISIRQIAIRLNAEGHTYYDKPFTFSHCRETLRNPVYTGNTVFGKTQPGEYYSFDGEGTIQKIKKDATDAEREALAQSITREQTHPAIISQKLWDLAVARRARETDNAAASNRVFAPRSADYYLKGILVCGHCGKYMTCRREKKGPLYICSGYSTALSSGHAHPCGYQTISHAEAEQMVFAKLTAMNVEFETLMANTPKEGMRRRIKGLDDSRDDNREAQHKIIDEGVAAVVAFFKTAYELDDKALRALKLASQRYLAWGGRFAMRSEASALPVPLAVFKAAVGTAEAEAVAKAKAMVAKLTKKHSQLTMFQATTEATPLQRQQLRGQVVELEGQLASWQSKCKPVRERLREVGQNYRALKDEQDQLLKEWDGMDDRVKGEALRRIISKLVLYWNKEWHAQEAVPSRPRKTARPGRYRYTLDLSKITWEFAGSDMCGTW